MIWSSKRAVAASLPLLVAHACQPLSDIPDDVCGNRVVEPERGEDCDDDTPACYPPGEANQCRFACATTADCVVGHACGLDGICRAPAGVLALVTEERDETGSLEMADFDADGRLDLLRTTSDNVEIQHFATDFTPEETLSIGRNSDGAVLAADLDGELGSDLVVPTPIGLGGASGLGVYLSEVGRSFTPASFASFPIAAQAIRGVSIDATFPPTDREIVAIVQATSDLGGEVVLFGISTRSDDQALQVGGGLPHPNDVVGMSSLRWGIGFVTGCEWVALAERGASSVRLYRPCDQAPQYGWKQEPIVPASVVEIAIDGALVVDPSSAPGVAELFAPLAGIDAVFTGDFNLDGLEDLAVTAMTSSAGEPKAVLHVAYQAPGMQFHSQRNLGPLETPDGTTAELVFKGNAPCVDALGLPLAVADVNADGIVDAAFSNGTAVSIIGDFYDIRCEQDWRRAGVGDFDGSGTLDFVGARGGTTGLETGIEVLISTEDGVFTRYLVATENPVDFLVVENFDGDQADDFVYVERALDEAAQPFYAVFGQATGGFGQPKSLGSLPSVVLTSAGRSSGNDAAAEVVAVSARGGIGDDGSLIDAAGAVMVGSSAREVLAPYTVAIEIISGTPPDLNVDRLVTANVATVDGDFAGRGLALLTRDAEDAGAGGLGPDGSFRLMFAPLSDDTLLGPVAAGDFDPEDGSAVLDCRGCTIAAVPGASADVLWSFGSDGLHRYAATEDGFEAGEEIAMPSGLGADECDEAPAFDLGEPVQRERDGVERRDADGDGHDDVLVFAKRCDGGRFIREAVVFFNDGQGALSFDRMMRVSGTETCKVEAAALLQLDETPGLELVVAFAAPRDLVAEEGCPAQLLVFAPVTGAELAISDGVSLLGGAGVPALPYRPETLAAGDLNGDGIEDLALGGFDGFAVYQGLAVRP